MAERGQDYVLKISADGVTFTNIGKLTNLNLSRERETTETNNFDSPDWAESISTMRSWSISGEMQYIYDDAGQRLLSQAFASNDAYHVELTSTAGTVGVYEYSGEAFVTSDEIDLEMNEVAGRSIEFEGTGALTEAEISA